jgi:CheY-like chemotaxis protein
MAKTLLLADDSVTIQKVVSISFASEDVTLVTVDNGDDAIDRAKETRPDLVLADVVMPGKSGYEVCEAIKADPDLRHIPVLLLSGTFEAFDEERAARAGAAGHVAKPFEAQSLVDQVNQLLADKPPSVVPARPIAAPETVEVPAAANRVDSFDFFDDDLAELDAPIPGAGRPYSRSHRRCPRAGAVRLGIRNGRRRPHTAGISARIRSDAGVGPNAGIGNRLRIRGRRGGIPGPHPRDHAGRGRFVGCGRDSTDGGVEHDDF